ncbi:MAG TPA: endonuclease/exonuclease/phosphatase family protein [Candidatus Limnocylindrales bacterium]|nr:endonuclease/exonuclease/phosphatase family protein [Candidatus Limnocylindrales bacterium]
MPSILAATLNVRNIADRWPERLPLLLADMAALQPDVIGLQEVVFAVQQDRLLGAAGEARYVTHRGWAGRPEYGNAILARVGGTLAPPQDESVAGPEASSGAAERLDLGRNRCALRLPLSAGGGVSFAFTVTHLHHAVADESAREEQALQLLAWLGDKPEPVAQVVVGDFNAEPTEPAYARMVGAGFRSAHSAANGVEPDVTWPSGIQAPGMDTDGDPGCLDYIWVRGPIEVESCRVVFDRPAAEDPTLYPSDHVGLAARLRIGA